MRKQAGPQARERNATIEIEPNERLFCPTHGDTLSIEEARRIAFDNNKDEIIDEARKFAIDSLRGSFKK